MKYVCGIGIGVAYENRNIMNLVNLVSLKILGFDLISTINDHF